MSLSPDRAARLVDRHTIARSALERSLIGLLSRLWRSTVRNPFDGAQAYEFARRAAAANATAERSATRLASTFTRQWLSESLDAQFREAKLLAVDSVRGTAGAEVFDRVPAAARRALLREDDLDELARLEEIERQMAGLARGSIALASRRGATETIRLGGVTHWRRMIRPELSEGGTCGLCIAASTRVYRVENLMPLHDLCNCLVVPAISGGRRVDPAEVLNEADLATVVPTSVADLGGVYKAADGSTFAEQLKRTRFQVNAHGELGAVLSLEGRKVRGSSEAARDTARARARRDSDPLGSVRAAIERLERRAAAGENVAAELGFQREQEAALTGLV